MNTLSTHTFATDGGSDLDCLHCPLPKAHKIHAPAAPTRVPRDTPVLRATRGYRHGDAGFDVRTDYERLNDQSRRVYDAIWDGQWRTLREIADITGDPEASISARLRDFRKTEFGTHTVERRRRGGASAGTWEYACATMSAPPEDGTPRRSPSAPAPVNIDDVPLFAQRPDLMDALAYDLGTDAITEHHA